MYLNNFQRKVVFTLSTVRRQESTGGNLEQQHHLVATTVFLFFIFLVLDLFTICPLMTPEMLKQLTLSVVVPERCKQ